MESEEDLDLSLSDPEDDDLVESVSEIKPVTLQPLPPVVAVVQRAGTVVGSTSSTTSGTVKVTAIAVDKDSESASPLIETTKNGKSSQINADQGVNELKCTKDDGIGDSEWRSMLQSEKAAREVAEVEAASAMALRRQAEEDRRKSESERERVEAALKRSEEERKKAEEAAKKLEEEKAAVETAKGDMLTRLRGIVEEAMKRKREADEGKAAAEAAAAEAGKQKDKAVSEREEMRKERDAGNRERDIARSAKDAAMRSRDEAVRDRETALKAKEAAVRAKESAEKLRAEALEAAEKLRKECNGAVTKAANMTKDLSHIASTVRKEEQRVERVLGLVDRARGDGESASTSSALAQGRSMAGSEKGERQQGSAEVNALLGEVQSEEGREAAEAVKGMVRLLEAAGESMKMVREEVEEREVACAVQVSQLEARIAETEAKLAATQSECDKWRAALDAMEERLLEIERMDEVPLAAEGSGDTGESSAGSATAVGGTVTQEISGRVGKQEGEAGAGEVVSGAGSEVASETRVQERVGAVRQKLRAAQAGRELMERELAAERAKRVAAVAAGAAAEAKMDAARREENELRGSLDHAHKTIEHLRKELDSARHELAGERAGRSALQQSLLELQQRLEEAAQQITDLGVSLQSSESEAATWQEAAKEEAAAGTAAAQELEAVKQQLASSQVEAQKWQAAAEDAQALLSSHMETAAAAVAAREAAERSLSSANRRVTSLREHNEMLQKMLDAASSNGLHRDSAERGSSFRGIGRLNWWKGLSDWFKRVLDFRRTGWARHDSGIEDTLLIPLT